MRRPSLMIVGKHRLLCDCLAALLAERFEGIEQCRDPQSVPDRVREQSPELLLIDVEPQDEWDPSLIHKLNEDQPELKIVLFGLPNVESDIMRFIETGAHGYVVKEAPADQLHAALDSALRGEAACPPSVMRMLFSRLAELSNESRSQRQIDNFDLTPREVEVLTLIADGLSNQEIADKLCLSLHTVKNHVHRILDKLGAKHRLEAAEKAYQARWLPQRPRQRADFGGLGAPRRLA